VCNSTDSDSRIALLTSSMLVFLGAIMLHCMKYIDAPPSSLCDPKKVQRVGFAKLVRNLVSLLASSTKRGRRVVLEAPGLD
jgi:hypothetical protein